MRPLWFEFPEAASLFAIDDQFMLGPALLVAPVLEESVNSRAVTLPAGPTWYDAATGASVGSGSPVATAGSQVHDKGYDQGEEPSRASMHQLTTASLLHAPAAYLQIA